MEWRCIKDIRRYIDENIDTIGRDVLRRELHRKLDDVCDMFDNLNANYCERVAKQGEIMAETAKRNVRYERALMPVLECRIERIDGLDSPEGEFMTSSEFGVCDADGNEVDNHSIANALNAVRECQRIYNEGAEK